MSTRRATDKYTRPSGPSILSSLTESRMGVAAGSNPKVVILTVVVIFFVGVYMIRETTPGSQPPLLRCPSLAEMRTQALEKASANEQNRGFYKDTFDAVKSEERAAAIGQRGATVWMTGLSGSGKSTIGKELERRLVLQDHLHMYRIDGDNLRFGLSKELTLTPEDRQENIRRAAEVSLLFADSGALSLVSLISPYRQDRLQARKIHERHNVPFLEVFVDVPIAEAQARDPKGLYKKHREGVISKMTGIDAPYEPPADAEIVLKTGTCCENAEANSALQSCKKTLPEGTKADKGCSNEVKACVNACVDHFRTSLLQKGYVVPKKVEKVEEKAPCPEPVPCTPPPKSEEPETKAAETKAALEPHPAWGHADGYRDGTTPPNVIHDDPNYWVSDEVTAMQPVPLRDVDVQWVQVIGEGWASPLKGPMREAALVQALHFNSLLVDLTNTSGAAGSSGYGPGPDPTNFGDSKGAAKLVADGSRVSMPVPIVIPICKHTKMLIKRAMKRSERRVVLVSPAGEPVAVLQDPEVYDFRKEEMITRSWGSWDPDHPYIKELIEPAGDYLLGGELFRIRRIKFRDGLDKWRLTPAELIEEFKAKNAEGVYAFQTRNPTHAGHAHLMKDGRRQLMERGYKNPVLWLSPLGGWTKSDDVPLDVRVKQHQAVLDEGMLDAKWTVLSIWPSPMLYSGPTEVQWHAKSRRVAGADFFIVGRDPAGLSYSKQYAKAHNQSSAADVYDADHGRYVLQVSPGMENMGLLASGAVHYDKTDGEMKPKPSGMSKEEFNKRFLKISGSKMREMGRRMVEECAGIGAIPEDWASNPSCVPPKFMVPTGWKIMREYYKNRDDPVVAANAVMQAKQRPQIAENAFPENATKVGLPGQLFAVFLKGETGRKISPWHDIPLKNGDEYNMVVEIPKGTNSKFEVQKELPYNPIKQDVKKGKPRFYTYGLAFFNNGMFPQTWEDSTQTSEGGHKGDNDPLDVMEVGQRSFPIGSVVKVKILGNLALLDEGEIDHKILALAVDDPDASRINDIESLKEVKGEAFLKRLVNWLKMYKTTDKSDPDAAAPNTIMDNDKFEGVETAKKIIADTNKRWEMLRAGTVSGPSTKDFWLKGE